MLIKIALAVFIALILFLLFSVCLAAYIMRAKRRTPQEVFERQSKICDLSFYNELEKTVYTVTSFDRYLLHLELLRPKDDSDKYIIISHGYSNTRLSCLKFAKLFLDKGFNCIIYDLRGHGENKKTFLTYSIREGKDIASIIGDARDRFKNISVLGLIGESLGASSSVAALKHTQDLDFVIADCGFSDIENVLRLGCRHSHLPEFFIDIANIGATIFFGHSFKKMRPVDCLENNKVPILFIHGDIDRFVTPDNSKRMFDAATCRKRLYFAKKAGHTKALYVDGKKYSDEIDAFFEEIGI